MDSQTPDTPWVIFTRRTNDPKLTWLEGQLKQAGIQSERRGASFHAPSLWVKQVDLAAAWDILGPVDDLADDDFRFQPRTDWSPLDDGHGSLGM